MLRTVETACLIALCGGCLLANPLAAQTGPTASLPLAVSADAALPATTTPLAADQPTPSAAGLRSRWPGFLVPDAGSAGALLANPAFVDRRRPRHGALRPSVLLAWSYTPRKLQSHEASSFSKYGESTGQLAVDYAQRAGAGFSVDAALPLLSGLGLRLGGEYLHRGSSARAAAQVPHPFYYSRARSMTYTSDAGILNETAFHVGALYALPIGPLRVSAFAGVALSSVEMDIVNQLVFTQVYPYDAPNISVVSTASERVRKFAAGPDAGLTLEVPLFGHVGVGATARYSGVTTTLVHPPPAVPVSDDQTVLGQQFIRPAAGTSLKIDTRAVRLAIGTCVRF